MKLIFETGVILKPVTLDTGYILLVEPLNSEFPYPWIGELIGVYAQSVFLIWIEYSPVTERWAYGSRLKVKKTKIVAKIDKSHIKATEDEEMFIIDEELKDQLQQICTK